MAVMHQVSFYHECGHSEHCVWVSNEQERGGVSTTSFESAILPAIDFARVIVDGTMEKDSPTEVHYQMAHCGHCSGTIRQLWIKPVGKLSESALKERRMLWCSLVDSSKIPLQTLEKSHYSASERVALEAQQLARETAASAGMRALIVDEIQRLQHQLRQLDRERKWYQDFTLLHFHELQLGVPLKDRTHLYTPGWYTELFAAVDDSSIPKNETCSVCKDPDYLLQNGRVCKLPCGHAFHFSCIEPWFGAHGSSNCPTCRAEYKILSPPDWKDSTAHRFGPPLDLRHPDRWARLSIALADALLAERPLLQNNANMSATAVTRNEEREEARGEYSRVFTEIFFDRWDQYTRE
ncbi:uncharacterized protein PAC_08725 [Phialocephala subalpina]|uniref:RING-type domain-containing protein n=1 Tax=Phialocephala subalpina TaxID=576137 RepID=A0A1L7X1F1_9HELO|nr:uncharacterized protein PAC_08725 [Phialocephala subalpina]